MGVLIFCSLDSIRGGVGGPLHRIIATQLFLRVKDGSRRDGGEGGGAYVLLP